MRPQKIDDHALLGKLMEVFRSKGYEGSSLNELATSAGLKKASLYHRFPGGKEEIATAVLTYTQEWGDTYISSILYDTTLAPKTRLSRVIKNIDTLYGGGEKICLLRALSMDTELPVLEDMIASSMQDWINGFTFLGKEFGYSAKEASQKATQVLIHIQGALIISKGLKSTHIFKDILITIKKMYLPTT